jgi:predicted amidohydrolase
MVTARMKIHACQMDIVWEDKPANFARARALLAASRPEPGSLVLLPELFATGFTMNSEALAEAPGGDTERFLARLAAELGVFLMGGVIGRATAGRPRNLAVVFGPDGREVARYAKMQPFSPGGESRHYEAGGAPVVFPWRECRVAPFICYDLRFPEIFRPAARAGAELITVIANWPVTRIAHWTALLRARAIENQAYVAGVNRCGTDPTLTYNGHSLIVSPQGEVLAEAVDGEKVISATVDLESLRTYRKNLPFLADMRPG